MGSPSNPKPLEMPRHTLCASPSLSPLSPHPNPIAPTSHSLRTLYTVPFSIYIPPEKGWPSQTLEPIVEHHALGDRSCYSILCFFPWLCACWTWRAVSRLPVHSLVSRIIHKSRFGLLVWQTHAAASLRRGYPSHHPICFSRHQIPEPKASIEQASHRSMQRLLPVPCRSSPSAPLRERRCLRADWLTPGRLEMDQAPVVITLSAARPMH